MRISDLQNGFDRTGEVTQENFTGNKDIKFSSDSKCLSEANCFIVTVPTPVDKEKKPDFEPLRKACREIGPRLKRGNVIVFESTVYPGATEEQCVPILIKESGLHYCSGSDARDVGFHVGYSPERINPGDKSRSLASIPKITSGSSQWCSSFVKELYSRIIDAEVVSVSSIKVAEASNVIENAQRDINIAFMNELSLIFARLQIDTNEVLAAARTKWNFLDFKPGLVGGHCIGVDPYYLASKAAQVGYCPDVILSGRRVNDSMASYVAETTLKLLSKLGRTLSRSVIVVCGLTFKENCPDVRNSRAFDIVDTLLEWEANVLLCDPLLSENDLPERYRPLFHSVTSISKMTNFDALILAVPHDEFVSLGTDLLNSGNQSDVVVFDVQGLSPIFKAHKTVKVYQSL